MRKNLTKSLKKIFKIAWLFDEIENWLKVAKLPTDKEAFIVEKTKQLKKHKI